MGDKSQVTLNWKRHEGAVKDGIYQFFESGFMMDTKLTCRGKELKAHKLILSLFSSVLKKKLEEKDKEEDVTFDGDKKKKKCGQDPIVVVDVSEMVERRDDIEQLVQFLYTGKITVPRNRIQSLRHLAENLKVQSLIAVIRDEVKESHEEENRTQKLKAKQKVVQDDTSDDNDDNWNDFDNNSSCSSEEEQKNDDDDSDIDGSEEKEQMSNKAKKRKKDGVTTRKSRKKATKRAKIDCEKNETSEFDDVPTSEQDSDDSNYEATTSRSKRAKKRNVKTRKSELQNVEEKEYVFRPFDDDDEFDSDEDEDVKIIRNIVNKQKETSSNYIETTNECVVNDDKEQRFAFDESDDYGEHDEIYEWENKRKWLPPRMNKTRSVKAKMNFVKNRQIFRHRVPFMHCELCEFKTRYLDLIKRHVRKQHVYTPVQVYHCTTCRKSFRMKDMYDLHQLTHKNPGEEEQKCPKCKYKTSNLFSLRRHLACKHKVDTDGNPLERRFSCSQCEYKCVHVSQLRCHVSNKHSDKSVIECEECDYKCRDKYHLDLHVSAVHRNERNFMCEICGYNSKTKGALAQHKASHTNERNFECEICGLKFNRSSYLKTHRRVHDTSYKPFVCDVCGHKTNRKLSLEKHMRRHLPGRVDGRRGRKKGVRRCANGIRTINTMTTTDTTTSAQSSTSNSSSCSDPPPPPPPTVGFQTVEVQNQPIVTNQSQPTIYNNNCSYQQSYGLWMCNF